ncbi:MAG TPA: 2-phospho-L-lactate guanylyltransferase [Polyangiaceae bacterium]|nr:2-phospho-L-lactate guanylyltransferase [Polyangiaceae bacterium]
MSLRNPWALVPVKAFERGKSRLSPVLSDEARAAFARALFDHVLDVLTRARTVEGVLVATDSLDVAAAARTRGADALLDPPGPKTLASVVDSGLSELAARGVGGALVVMADLPLLDVGDVHRVVSLLEEHAVVVARARDGRQTNALALAPPGRLRTAFGQTGSFSAHVSAARAAGLRFAVLENERLAFDVDVPEDHASLVSRLEQRAPGSRVRS